MSTRQVGVHKQARMLAEMVKRGMTYKELEAISGLTHESVATWLRALHKRRLVYVTSWNKDSIGRSNIPVFAWGPWHNDAVKPVVSSADRVRMLRSRKGLA